MHEDLLGYLLGALEPHDMRRVAEWLREDPEAQAELAKLEQSLRPLEENCEPVEPPPADLISRTMASLPPLPAAGHVDTEDRSSPGTQDSRPLESAVESATESDRIELTPMQSRVEVAKGSTMTWIDWASGAVAAAVLLGLLLPSLAQGRFEARKIACQDRLRQFGTALTRYVTLNRQEHLPEVSETGPEAFAGVYTMRLKEAGLLLDPNLRWCPSVDRPTQQDFALLGSDDVMSVNELHLASVDRLKEIQRLAGGHYAYTLGVVDQDQFKPPRYESRSSFAVMSDAPMIGMSGGQVSADRIGHNGRGINVLFEDGRVQFIPLASLESMPDHPLLNHRGEAEAGVTVDDASLAPSWRPPFVDVRQR